MTGSTNNRPPGPRRGPIFLESLKPDQPDIGLDENGESQDRRCAVIAEYLLVLKPPLDWTKPAFDQLDE
jgi:hypothetical protein